MCVWRWLAVYSGETLLPLCLGVGPFAGDRCGSMWFAVDRCSSLMLAVVHHGSLWQIAVRCVSPWCELARDSWLWAAVVLLHATARFASPWLKFICYGCLYGARGDMRWPDGPPHINHECGKPNRCEHQRHAATHCEAQRAISMCSYTLTSAAFVWCACR